MSITRKEVEQIARLAHLALERDEVEALGAELGSILDHMRELGHVSLEGVPPMEGALKTAAPMREDVAGATRLARPPAELAPVWREGFFVVPRLAALDAEGGESGS